MKLEARIDKRMRQVGCSRVGNRERQPRAQGRKRRSGENLGDLGKGGLLADHDAAPGGHAGALKECRPGKSRREHRKLRRRVSVIESRQVALLDMGPAGFGNAALERHHGGGTLVCRGPVAQCQQPLDVVAELAFLVGQFGLQVIVTIRHRQPALLQVDRIVGGILQIDVDRYPEETPLEARGRVPHQRCQLLARATAADGAKLGRERRQAQRLEPGLVHEGVVERADLAFQRARLVAGVGAGLFNGSLFDNGAQLCLGALAHQLCLGDIRPVGRNDRTRNPGAIAMLEEVVARIDRRVHRRHVQTQRRIQRTGKSRRRGWRRQCSRCGQCSRCAQQNACGDQAGGDPACGDQAACSDQCRCSLQLRSRRH